MLALRVVIAGALLHEAPGDAGDPGRFACSECGHVGAQTAFCPSCGIATRAASPTSARRSRSGPSEQPDGLTTVPVVHRASFRGLVLRWIAGVGVAVLAAFAVAVLAQPAPGPFVCPPDCTRPPLGTPVETNPRYNAADGAFSVSYPAEGSAYQVTFDPPGRNGVGLKYTAGDTGTLTLFGEPATGRTPAQIAQKQLSSDYGGATVAYEIPNASLGYQPGYGVVADVPLVGRWRADSRQRVIVIAAVKHDYALIAVAVGPYHEFSPDYGNGHPSPANLEVAMDMGKYVNSFRWSGDNGGPPS